MACKPPHDLAIMPNWLMWRLVYVDGHAKPRKVPFYTNGNPRVGTQGTDEDRAQLVTFEQAMQCLSEPHRQYTGVGFALQPDAGVVALDFDNCVEGGTIAKHVEDLCAGTYAELSPSGTGVRAFFRGTLLSRKDIKAERGAFAIEVFGHNGFVTFTGNVTETCSLFGWDETLAPITAAVLDMYRSRGWDEGATPGAALSNPLALLQPTLNITDGEVAEVLQKISPDMPYDQWVKVGMAVHQQTHGQGFDIWHNWSKQGTNYGGEDDCRTRWESFGRYKGGAHVTFKFVMDMAHDGEVKGAYAARDGYRARIESCEGEFELREKLCREIARDERLDDSARSLLEKALQKKLNVFGAPLHIAQVRKMIKPVGDGNEATSDARGVPEWVNGWVWVTDNDKFYHCESGIFSTKTSFNAEHNRYMPRMGAANIVPKSAADAALEDFGVPAVTRLMYLPVANNEGTGVFEFDSVQCVNMFRPSSVPKEAGCLSAAGQEAVRLVVQHLNLVCGGRSEVVDHLLAVLAYNVQKPGTKIRHAILIKGIEGDGKSLIGTLMSAVLGPSNVKHISPKVLGTDFTDWAHGACVGVLEEIRLAGHNRHEIYNALKPYITNDHVPVHPKGKAEYNVVNTMNYIAFTNHTDALPLSDTDRRWMVIFTPHSTAQQLESALRQVQPDGPEAYWNKLHDALTKQPAQLRRWLLDYPIASTFNPHGSAPFTQEKDSMKQASASPEEELVRELLGEGGPGMGDDILSSTAVLDAAALADSDVSLQTTTINRVLTRMGWLKLPKRVKWRNRLHRVWVRGNVPSNVQRALDATLPHDGRTPVERFANDGDSSTAAS